MNDALNIWDVGVVKGKRNKSQPSSTGSGKKQKTSTIQGFKEHGRGYQGQGQSRSSPGGRSF